MTQQDGQAIEMASGHPETARKFAKRWSTQLSPLSLDSFVAELIHREAAIRAQVGADPQLLSLAQREALEFERSERRFVERQLVTVTAERDALRMEAASLAGTLLQVQRNSIAYKQERDRLRAALDDIAKLLDFGPSSWTSIKMRLRAALGTND